MITPFPRRLLTGLLLLVFLPGWSGATEPAAEASPEDPTYILPKLEVKTNLVCSFGIGIIAMWNRQTERITRVFINEVNEGSTADRLGLRRGDEILSINGKKIAEMKGGNKPGSDLFALLVDRPAGEEIDVEVAVRVVKRVTLPAAKPGVPGPFKPAAELRPAPTSG